MSIAKDVMDDLNIGDTYTYNGKTWLKVGENRWALVIEESEVVNKQEERTIH